MKPFNLEEALAGKRVISDFYAIPATNFTKLNSTDCCFSAMFQGNTLLFNEKGERVCKGNAIKISLFMAPTTKTLYANVYCSARGELYVGSTYDSLKSAEYNNQPKAFVCTVQHTIEI